ncbi:hypothetical protein F751_6231 [Auxenochlorella protothecoides]|uniref:CDT1 Geminin-binding domain-containing protein n=1 Tax=Auxenochlorella protothecoides TaxID=3075 RepID=A0A087SK26_AUXPR|nr:hypothetical protein F751_6231 [Auxenochlorella protothecoides]KFM26080.1 hypothetical protein F751_6231 [Auxenochlorella protothecoides]
MWGRPRHPFDEVRARRGLALLAAAGVEYKAPSPSPRGDEGVAPSPQSPSPEPTKGKSPRKRGADPGSLQQPLPKKLAVYKDMFVAVQTVHGMMKARGARTTFQTIRPAVEEACSRRFTVRVWGVQSRSIYVLVWERYSRTWSCRTRTPSSNLFISLHPSSPAHHTPSPPTRCRRIT